MQLARGYLILDTSAGQRFCVAACLIVTSEVRLLRFRRSFHEEWGFTLRTFLVHRFIPRNEFTFRIVATTIKDVTAFTASFTNITVAASLWAIDTDVDRLCISALGIPRTREEFATGATGFNHHWTATFVTGFIGGLLFSGRGVVPC